MSSGCGRNTLFSKPLQILSSSEQSHKHYQKLKNTSLLPHELPVEPSQKGMNFSKTNMYNASGVIPGRWSVAKQESVPLPQRSAAKSLNNQETFYAPLPVDYRTRQAKCAQEVISIRNLMMSKPISSKSKQIRDKFVHGLLLESL